MTPKLLYFSFIVFFTTSLITTPLSNVILAQEVSPWQVAADIRNQASQAQKEMYAAARNNNPAQNHQAAAALVDEAAFLYAGTLQTDMSDLAPDAHRTIAAALVDAQTAALNGDSLALAAARGRLWTGLLWGSYDLTLNALAAGDTDSAAEWLRLREYRESTKVTIVENGAAQALADLRANRLAPAEAETIIANELRDAYFFRLRDSLNSLEKAIEKGFSTRAAEWAGLAGGYFDILQADFAAKQGIDTMETLAGNLASLEEAVIAEDWASVDEYIAAIRDGLANYQPVALNATEVKKRKQLLYLFTNLIYIEYKNGVKNGQITIPIEYQEALTFRDQAEAVFEELRPVIAANNPEGAERLAELLTTIKETMANLGKVADIKAMVEESLEIIEVSLAVKVDSNDIASSLVVINTLLDDALVATQDGRYANAERTRLEAYAMFENGMEQRLAHRAPLMTRELEGLFWEGTGGSKGLATLLREEAAPAEIEANIIELKASLDEAQGFLSTGLTSLLAGVNSFIIIFREGLEAVLIVGAILGYMRAVNAPKKYSAWIYAGIIAAIAFSVLTWWAAQGLITITVASRELIEGITSLIAVGVLFYVTNWLFHKVYVVDWMVFVKEKVGKALTAGSALALAGLGFTVVYREGLETVLFYQTLLLDAEPIPALIGFAAGVAVIAVVAYTILHLSKRIPLKPFFTATGILLLLLAFNFTGAGVRELQEASVVSATLLPWMPENLILMEVLGIFPTVETTIAQALFLLAVFATFGYSKWNENRKIEVAQVSA